MGCFICDNDLSSGSTCGGECRSGFHGGHSDRAMFTLRVNVMVRDGWSCRVCNRRGWQEMSCGYMHPDDPECPSDEELLARPNLHVHHITYERQGRELPGDLVTLCNSCHSKEHWRIRKGEPSLLA